ncbi:hypothetical protein CAPTEDRAFT_159405 [Capitella teleta]|uniref:Tetratricopeptide repeat domain 21B n=1 Tax=Capitella teleta TaxID=283909 RepID=R7UNS3_CAPTE|nr:hypothetical protein CAPTEDRAFT_159405 [Capitella teleta]|eukprot:ELU05036.1 hypothetical protein CAPTEDRAFT_159405 [Capitella teleta]
MQNAANEGLRKYGNDPLLKFFVGYSMVLENRVQEGIRELEPLKDKRDVNLAACMALALAHKKAKTVDREAIQELDARLKEERKQAGEKGLFFAGLFLVQTGKYDKAREYIDRMLKMTDSPSKESLALKGWLELLCGREAYVKKANKYFDEALGSEGIKDIDALFGKAKYMEMKRNFSGAMDIISQAVVAFPNFLPALLEKMRLQLALQDWEQTVETAQRALNLNSNCLQAQRYLILHQLSREGNYSEAASAMADLLQVMDREEPANAQLYDDFARVFGRICGRNAMVLQQSYFMAERAVQLDHTSADFLTELGFQLLMQGRHRDAIKCYRNAMKQDDTSVRALTGVIRCQLIENQLEDAAQQLDFLNEIQQSIGKSSELCYLGAVLAMKRGQAPEKVVELLNNAVEIHFTGLKGLPLGTEYFTCINPDLLLQMVQDYLLYSPQQPIGPGLPPSPVLRRSGQILDPLTRAFPGLMEALYLQGKIKFLAGDVEAAQSTLQHCLEVDSAYSDAHILMAQIHLHQNNFKAANQSLEVGLSYDFEIKEHPLYHLIKARILKKQGDTADAVKTLQIAMALPGVRNQSQTGTAALKQKKAIKIGVNDRVSVYLELAEAHRMLGEQHEAAKVMQDALNDFQGTPEEVRITISNADLAITRGDIEGALAMLRNIGPEQSYFVQAREKMADIYLHHRKDKRLYASCYKDLVDQNPNSHTSLLLGDAYMSIQEPEKAIEVYEAALKKNPRDTALASKIGQAYVKTHHYGKAISYYEASLRNGTQTYLRHDLAELLLKLRQFDKSEKVLKQALESDSTDLDTLMQNARYLVLLSKVYRKQDKTEDSVLQLNRAKEVQTRVLKRVQVEQPDAICSQKQLASNICCFLAEHCIQERDYEKAIKHYKEALSHMENDGKLMLELAKLYLHTEDLDACQHQCMTLVKNDKENDAATVMLADLMFRKGEYDQALFHFKQLLERQPDHYDALSRLVELMRRAGRLEEVPNFLELAENASGRASLDAGFNFCKGLFEWHQGNPNTALKYFNKSRKDSDWGTRAMYSMIEICLNPDNDTIGGEVFEAMDQDIGVAAEKKDSEQLAIRTAEKLLREMKPKPGDIKAKVLENMVLISTKIKGNVEKALASLMDICSNEQEHVGALYGMATAYMVLKQTPRARNTLKRMVKSVWNMEDADDLERAWLLLSDIYIQAGKYDVASDLLKKVIQYNKACCKAYEYLGFIMEKEQSYKEAAKNYELAWKYGNRSNPNIGYKLGFNYLKAKRYVDAVDICHHVLQSHPSYPKIRKDILDKSRQSLRM